MLSLTLARTVAIAAVCAVLCAFGTIAYAGSADARTLAANVPSGNARCMEDEPCWNWAVHGSHRRGVVTVYGTPRVVSVCAFQRLMRAGLIDYPPSERMRGDASAMRYARCPSGLTHNRASQ